MKNQLLPVGELDSLQLRSVRGKDVPAVYTSFVEEYAALRQQAALFDWSPWDLIEVSGEGSRAFLQEVLTRDVEYLMEGRALQSLAMNHDGEALALVTVLARPEAFWLECPPGTVDALVAFWDTLLQENGRNDLVKLKRLEEISFFALEGPYAWQKVGELLGIDMNALPYQGMIDATYGQKEVVLSRTGVTAEYGYKVYASHQTIEEIWQDFLHHNVRPAGWDVMEAAMLEVRQPNFYTDLGDDKDVLVAGWQWLIDIHKESFIGREALLARQERGTPYRLIGFSMSDAFDYVINKEDPLVLYEEIIGSVVQVVHIPQHARWLGLAKVKQEWSASTLTFFLKTDDGSFAPIQTISSPYITPLSWDVPIL